MADETNDERSNGDGVLVLVDTILTPSIRWCETLVIGGQHLQFKHNHNFERDIADYGRVLVMAVLSVRGNSVNSVMLVNTCPSFAFLTDEICKSLGINLQDHPKNELLILINGLLVHAHASKAHFEHVNVLGTNFKSSDKLCVNYP
jgi:hypothetical protein